MRWMTKAAGRFIRYTWPVLVVIAMELFLNAVAEYQWRSYCAAARARKVKLSISEFEPPLVPENQNFAALPMFKPAGAPAAEDPFALVSDREDRFQPDFGNPIAGVPINWESWQQHFLKKGLIPELSNDPPRDVLRALEYFRPQLDEWRQWRSRPLSRFGLDYHPEARVKFEHLHVIQRCVSIFKLKICADLAIADSRAALSDMADAMQGYRALANEPFPISVEYRLSILAQTIAAIGYGLHEHRWSDADLVSIDRELQKINIASDCLLFLSGERAEYNDRFNVMSESSYLGRKAMYDQVMVKPRELAWFMALIPPHLYRNNEIRANKHIDELQAHIETAAVSRVPDPSEPPPSTGLAYEFEQFYLFFYRMESEILAGTERRYQRGEIQVRQARIACALERYYISRRKFPETLADLTPQFLKAVPLDIYSGKPMIYRKHGTQSYALYSVGPNRIDDYAVIDPAKREGKQLDDIWLWAPAGR